MGAFPERNSTIKRKKLARRKKYNKKSLFNVTIPKKTLRSDFTPKHVRFSELWKMRRNKVKFFFTIQNPITFWLRLISMYTHAWPSVKKVKNLHSFKISTPCRRARIRGGGGGRGIASVTRNSLNCHQFRNYETRRESS